MKKFIFYWLPVFTWMGVIFFFSGRQRISLAADTTVNFLIFKTFHIVEYMILFVLSYRANRQGAAEALRDYYFAAFALTLIYAVSDEIHQLTVPTREGRLRDVIIDGIGAGIAWILLTVLSPRLPGKLRKWLGI